MTVRNCSSSPNRRFRPRRSVAGRGRIRASCTWFEGLYHTYRQVHRPRPEHDYSQHTMHANMAIGTKVAKSPVYPTGYSDASLETTARPVNAPALTARLQTHPRWTREQPHAAAACIRRALQRVLPTVEASSRCATATGSKIMKSRHAASAG